MGPGGIKEFGIEGKVTEERDRNKKDVLAIPTMLRSSRHRPRALLAYLLLERRVARAGVRALGQRRQRDVAAVGQPGRADELPLAPVPRREDLGGRGAAQDARMDEPRELHVRQVSRGAVDAFEVPDRLGSVCVRVSCVSLISIREAERQKNTYLRPKGRGDSYAEG